MDHQLPTRLRQSTILRQMLRDVTISMQDIIYPVFLVEGQGIRRPIASMPGQFHYSVDQLVLELPSLRAAGIQSLLLFGVPNTKDKDALGAYSDAGIIQQALRAIKSMDQPWMLITDICLCQYKSDGHCCFFDEKGLIARKQTLEVLVKVAISHAKAGADMLAPSDMMDGRIGALRHGLDQAGFEHLPLMAYSAKYASAYYGPFREAAHSAPSKGDRQAYQLDYHRTKEAMLEMELDIREGADVLMVKPGMPYLDIVQKASQKWSQPIAVYQVSGEYAMLKNAVTQGVLDEKAIYESLISFKRAGAKWIITYFAKDIQKCIDHAIGGSNGQ